MICTTFTKRSYYYHGNAGFYEESLVSHHIELLTKISLKMIQESLKIANSVENYQFCIKKWLTRVYFECKPLVYSINKMSATKNVYLMIH